MCSVIFRANTKKNNTKRYSQTANRKLKWNTKKNIQVIQKGQERKKRGIKTKVKQKTNTISPPYPWVLHPHIQPTTD